MSSLLWFLLVVSLAVCADPADEPAHDADAPRNVPLSKVEKDTRPPFRIDPSRPYRIELGRGSGRDGLDTVQIRSDGAAVLHRMREDHRGDTIVVSWETATVRLPAKALAKVLEAVEKNGLQRLHRAYHANVHDGTQWVLRISQGDREKSVYFNNHFPKEIVSFAKSLDGILTDSGLGKATWQPVPRDAERNHEKELWDSIGR